MTSDTTTRRSPRRKPLDWDQIECAMKLLGEIHEFSSELLRYMNTERTNNLQQIEQEFQDMQKWMTKFDKRWFQYK